MAHKGQKEGFVSMPWHWTRHCPGVLELGLEIEPQSDLDGSLGDGTKSPSMSKHLRHEDGIFLKIKPQIMIFKKGLQKHHVWDFVENLWTLEETGKE